MFYVNRDGVKLSAFRVTAADFNGTEFDGAPFEGDSENHTWLYLKMKSGVITLVNSRQTDYAVWSVPLQDGERTLASPGDYIVYNADTDDVFVCDGRLWALLMLGVEPIALPEVDVVLDPSVEAMDKGELAKLVEVRPGTPEELGIPDPVEGRTYGMVIDETISGFSPEDEIKLNDWCDRVHLAMGKLDGFVKRDWPAFLKEVEDILGERQPETLPLAWLKTYGIVGAMAKSFEWIHAGHMEFDSLQTAKCIGQTLVNQVTGKEYQKGVNYEAAVELANTRIAAARDWIIKASAGDFNINWMEPHYTNLTWAASVLQTEAPKDLNDLIKAVNRLVSEHYKNG